MLKTISLFFILSLNLQAEDLKVVFSTGEWEPYTSSTLAGNGIAAELVSAICKAVGISPEYRFYPWTRVEMMVLNGQVFGAFPYAVTKERSEKFNYSTPLYFGTNKFTFLAKNPKLDSIVHFKKIEDLKGFSVATITGSFYNEELKKYGIKVFESSNIKSCLQNLLLGRVDFFLDEQAVTNYTINKIYPDRASEFRTLPFIFGKKMANSILISKKFTNAEEITKKINMGIDIIKKNGAYMKIVNKYHLEK
jgi:polar amino acid transport system substrate-binding protein